MRNTHKKVETPFRANYIVTLMQNQSFLSICTGCTEPHVRIILTRCPSRDQVSSSCAPLPSLRS